MARSPGFGSDPGNSDAPFGLAFAAPPPNGLSLLPRPTRSPIIQKVRRQFGDPRITQPPTACRHPVSGTLSLPSSGCFSPFPHGTGALSVTEEYLGLEGGPPIFRQDGSCPALLEDLSAGFPYGAVTRSGPPFQALPVPHRKATGLVRVRSPLLTESRLMSVPPATEMFQFAGFASRPYEFRS